MRSVSRHNYLIAGIVAAVVAASIGCTSHTPVEESGVDLPHSFSDSGTIVREQSWWKAFPSDELDALIRNALSQNLDLQESWYRISEAQAIVRRENSSAWPFLDFDVGYRAQRSETSSNDVLDLGLTAGYELDLWGRIRSATEAERLRFMATEEDFHAAALSLSAEVTLAFLRLVTVRKQSGLLASQLETNLKVLQSLRNRFGSGQSLRGDILQQQQFIEQTRSDLIESNSQEQLILNQLSILLGKAPGFAASFTYPDDLPDLPPMPETGVPAQLLQRRPDIRAAYNRLLATDRLLAAAISERFPRISLSASVFTEDSDNVSLFDDWIRTLAANIALPVIDAGRRQSEVDRFEAVKMQQLANYSQVTLQAIREVEDAIIQEQKQQQQLGNITEQVRLAEETYLQVQRQYLNGVSDFLEVLTALSNEQRLRRQQLSAQLNLYQYRVALYRALAGQIATDNLQIKLNQES